MSLLFSIFTPLALVAAWISGTLLTGSYLVPAMVAGGLAATATLFAQSTTRRAVWFNLAFAIAACGIAATWFDRQGHSGQRVEERLSAEPLWGGDPELGHAAVAFGRSRVRVSWGGELVYDVTYTTDADGLRATPSSLAAAKARGNQSTDSPCVLIFGCSFAFGEGVNDDEVLAAQLEIQSKGRLRARNFAASGYGPHHMLAMIESGKVKTEARCHPTRAVYWAIGDHIGRAAGHPRADGHHDGPRYVIDGNERLTRDGVYDGAHAIADQFTGSELAVKLRAQLFEKVGAPEQHLFERIVQESMTKLSALYPGIEHEILYWEDGASPDARALVESLGVPVLVAQDALHSDGGWAETFELPHDGHATATAHQQLAAALLGRWGETPTPH